MGHFGDDFYRFLHAAVTQLSDAFLEDVSVTVMAQVDEASLASAFSSTSW